MIEETDWTNDDAVRWLRRPTAEDDKYSRGVVGMATGSERYPGAAVLGVDAAVRAGAGMVRYVGPDAVAHLVLQRRPEVVRGIGRVQAWLIGSGVDGEEPGEERTADFRHALEDGVPVVIDAGALPAVPGRVDGLAVLTPHAGELRRLLAARGTEVDADALSRDRDGWARRAAADTGAVVLLKGSRTVVAEPGGRLIRLPEATPWLSTAGTGDVLAGVLGAVIAGSAGRIGSTVELAESAAAGSLLHALAAASASGGGPIAALDVAEALPTTIARLLS
ncbi:NAD(P)H-hydrate dehydratase [Labedella populi]|uniref:ADP-dependent (S)-NAD(P)H-hydrate dehydratase n=1 Tax=Labedella populi TaxID=2498850 RepID=A0A444QG68_9MICO|nr:ADP/ATP-dependent (S)-NAD(P)H-hydrate dehydratase [Labedella populi]RWZ68582.1 NAD(P)H-hydrate dehydratase [Labedella populi]